MICQLKSFFNDLKDEHITQGVHICVLERTHEVDKRQFMATPPKIDKLRRSRMCLGVFLLIIPSEEDSQSLLRAYMHGKKEASYDTSACFVVEKNKAK